ncbi:MAG: deoxyribose-phosphate aldolase, partial [Eudoraea sp.]|nr:deoxyribose-phosphate aldolase [Eudoraea sp.]
MLKKYFLISLSIFVLSCKDSPGVEDVQKIIDTSIEVAGGELYKTSNISFRFRDIDYVLEHQKGTRALMRMQYTDSGTVTDIKKGNSFERMLNEERVSVTDSMATVYGNSVNSVHYFALLPYGLNDPAV